MTTSPRHLTDATTDRARSLALAGGGLLAFLGCLVLTGWHTRNEQIVRVSAGFVPMQFNTALGFLLAGGSLLAGHWQLSRLALALGTLVSLLGGLASIQHFGGVDLQIDQAFFKSWLPVPPGIHPGRMSPLTAVCFTAAGAGLALAAWNPPPRLRHPLRIGLPALLIGGIAILALTGYAIGIKAAYGWWRQLTAMAVHTAAGFLVLALALLARALAEGAARRLHPLTWLPLPAALVLITVLAIETAQTLRDLAGTARSREAAFATILELEQVRAGLDAWQNGAYRAVIEAEPAFPAGSQAEATRLRDRVGRLRGRVMDAPAEQKAALELEQTVSQLIRWRLQVEAARARGLATARAEAASGEGGRLWAKARTGLGEIESGARALLARHHHEVRDVTRDTTWLLLLGSGAAFGLVALTGIWLQRETTRRGRLEEELKDSRERFELAARGAVAGIWDWNLVTNTNYCSSRWLELLGYTSETAAPPTGRWTGLLHPDDQARVAAALAAHLAQRAPFDQEFRLRTQTGAYRWFEAGGQAKWDEAGRPVRMAGSLADVTEKKAAEDLWRQQEARFRLLVEAVSDYAILSLDEAGRVTSWNPGARGIIGYADEDVIGRHFSLFFTRDEVAAGVPERQLAEARSTGRTEHEGWRVRQNGARFFAHAVITALRDAEGQFCGFAKVTRDITERRQARDLLAANEALLRQFIQHAPAAMAMLDDQLRYLQASDRWMRDYRLEGRPVIGQGHYDLFPATPETCRAVHRRVLTGAVEHCDEELVTLADGRQEWLEWEARPWRRTGGEIGGLILFTQMITERKAAEARRAARLDVTRALAEATTLQGVATGILRAVGEHLAWDFGAVWNADEPGQPLACVAIWPDEADRHPAFAAATRAIKFTPGLGLPGTIWITGRPLWIPDLTRHGNFPRALSAARDGLHAGFGFPVTLRGQVLGVIEFFSREVREPDAITMEMFASVGVQVGQFMERRRFEEQLRLSEERFRSAVEHSAIGFALVSTEGHWLKVNRALCQIVGYSEAELQQITFQDITHPEDLHADLALVKQVLAGEIDHYHLEKRYFHKQGHEVGILLSVSLARSAEGQPLHFISQIQDITERRRAEHQLRQSVAEKEVLLREIHHRVKNNLQVVSSVLQLHAGYVTDPRDHEIFKECQGRIRAMSQVHERLYSSANLAAIDFAEHLQELVTLLLRGQSSAEREIQVEVQAEPLLLDVNVAIPLGLIANELVVNALKHAFQGMTQGRLRVELAAPLPGRVRLRVADDGVGLPATFDLDTSRSLGLRLIRTLARQLRGEFVIATSGGASFDLTFSLDEPNQQP